MDSFKCPSCKSTLNVHHYIPMAIRTENDQKGMVLLSSELGDYKVHFSPNLHVRIGDKIRFHCPTCQENLGHPSNRDLVQIQRTNEYGVDSTVVFSSVYGEHTSFEIKEENLISYGSNALKFTDPEWYLKK